RAARFSGHTSRAPDPPGKAHPSRKPDASRAPDANAVTESSDTPDYGRTPHRAGAPDEACSSDPGDNPDPQADRQALTLAGRVHGALFGKVAYVRPHLT